MTTRVSRTPTLAAFLLKQWVYREFKKLWERSFQVLSHEKAFSLRRCFLFRSKSANKPLENFLLLNKKLLYASNPKGIFLANQKQSLTTAF